MSDPLVVVEHKADIGVIVQSKLELMRLACIKNELTLSNRIKKAWFIILNK